MTPVFVFLCMLFCVPHQSRYFEKVAAPSLTALKLAPSRDAFNNLIEAAYMQWEIDSDETSIQYYTLLRKLPSDSIFDVFSLSQRIPPEVTSFYDPVALDIFPTDGFDTLQYRIFAVDIYGRPGDTSETHVLLLAPQPKLKSSDMTTGCFQWESWIRGGQISHAEFWIDSSKCSWSSKPEDAFPQTDVPALFSSCKPDSCDLFTRSNLCYALFIDVVDAHSIKVGKIQGGN
ncbi:MAG TPA: hypothetical protein VHO70_03160 [Chitinispirillaceae bacterium]|nr:hypothetical protein [Chitinispirillaceae bacterium]